MNREQQIIASIPLIESVITELGIKYQKRDDYFQEAILFVINFLDKDMPDIENFNTYLRKSVKNHLIKYQNKEKRDEKRELPLNNA